MGCELPSTMEEEREYLRCRWGGIHGLGLQHSLKAAELLEVLPSPSTLMILGSLATERSSEGNGWAIISKVHSPPDHANFRFQDVSRDLGWELVLI